MREPNTSKGCFADNILKIVASSRIIPIIDTAPGFDRKRLVDLYYRAGFRTVEVRMNRPGVEDLVRIIRDDYPDTYIFAGTCLSQDDFRKAAAIGLDIFISPVFEPELLEYCCIHSLPYIPCVNSAATLNTAFSMGYSVLKFYPAEKLGGADFLREVFRSDDDIRFMPSGGITAEKITKYLDVPNVAACCTSHISPLDLQAAGDWERIDRNIAYAARILKTRNEQNE